MMSKELWDKVDSYINETVVKPDQALVQARAAIREADFPPISVTPSQGKLLTLLAQIHGARRILEIGALGGYSTICLARALPADGHLISLEVDPAHAEVARANVARAGLGNLVEVRVGPALELLPKLAAETREPFDFFFLDADKQSNAEYFRWALKLSRPGSLIVIDNVVQEGAVIDEASTDPAIVGTRELNELLSSEPRVSATEIQTVGSKGHDGFAVALVLY